MERLLLAGLLKIELPTGDVRLCDGGHLTFDSEQYLSVHPVFGVLEQLETFEETVGDQAPTFTLRLLPHPDAAADAISNPDFQGSRVRMWIAEVDPETGLVDGDPDLMVDAAIDVTTLRLGGKRKLEISCVSAAERLFERNKGNVLSGAFHKRIYPGEKGLDNASGVSRTFAWGTNSVRGVR